MKKFKWLWHPYTLMTSFFLILISGEHLGGFYLLYLLLGLPFMAAHSILGFLGLLMLLITHAQKKRLQHTVVVPGLFLLAALLLAFSLFFFFYLDKEAYNYGTFVQPLPMVTLAIFSIFWLLFIIKKMRALLNRSKVNHFSL